MGENVMSRKRAEGLSIRQWVVAALAIGLIIIFTILVYSTDFAVRMLEQETAAQYRSILTMRQASLDESLGSASAALVSYHIRRAYEQFAPRLQRK